MSRCDSSWSQDDVRTADVEVSGYNAYSDLAAYTHATARPLRSYSILPLGSLDGTLLYDRASTTDDPNTSSALFIVPRTIVLTTVCFRRLGRKPGVVV